MSKFATLKDITIKMRDLAMDEVDKNFPGLEQLDKELHVLSLFNHGFGAQGEMLKNLYNIDPSELEQEEGD